MPSGNNAVMFLQVYSCDGNWWRDTTLSCFKGGSNAAVWTNGLDIPWGSLSTKNIMWSLLNVARHPFPYLENERQKEEKDFLAAFPIKRRENECLFFHQWLPTSSFWTLLSPAFGRVWWLVFPLLSLSLSSSSGMFQCRFYWVAVNASNALGAEGGNVTLLLG